MAKNSKMPNEMMSDESSCCEPGMACAAEKMSCHSSYGRRCGGKKFVGSAAGILFLMGALWIGLQIWGNPWYKNIRAEFTSAPYARTISVEGVGKLTVKPDIARISLSVASVGKTVKAVTEDNNKKMNAVIDELKKLGIKAEDIQTTAYDLYPQYEYSKVPAPIYSDNRAVPLVQSAPKIIGYDLNQTVGVKIRDLTKSDEVIDRSTTAGANQVGSLSFDLDDASQLKKTVRKEAFAKAQEKAQEMAAAAGVKLGRVVTFSEGFGGGIPFNTYANFNIKAMDTMEASVAPSIEAGSQELNINVSVTYEIE